MLGLGRASELAGWWNSSIKSVDFTSSSTFTPVMQRANQYSFATYPTGGPTWGSSDVASFTAAGTINISGLTGYTGYNQYRCAMFAHFYPNTTGWSGLGDNSQYSTIRQQWTNNFGATQNQQDLSVGVASSNLVASYLNQSLTVGTLTSRLDKWVTIAVSTAETSSIYTNWAGGSSAGANTLAIRITAWDTLTGAFISKSDAWISPAGLLPGDWSTNYVSPITVQQSFANNTLTQYNFSGYSTAATPIGGYWYAWGTTFDPVSETNTSFLTPAPSSQIGQAVAFYQTQFTGYTTSTTTNAYNINPSTSLYTQASNIDWYGNFGNTTVRDAQYSNTILVRNS
jgi:hypothetical protein